MGGVRCAARLPPWLCIKLPSFVIFKKRMEMRLGYLAIFILWSLSSCHVSYSSRYISNDGAYIRDLHFINDTTFCFDWLIEEHFSPRLASSGQTVGSWHQRGRTIWLHSERQPEDFVSILEVTDSNSISDSMTITVTYKDTIGAADCIVIYSKGDVGLQSDIFHFIIAGRSAELTNNETVVMKIEKPSWPYYLISFVDQGSVNHIINSPLDTSTGEFPDAFSLTLAGGGYRYFTQQKVKIRKNRLVILYPKEWGGHVRLIKCNPALP